MSKTQLRKELQQMSATELTQVILDLYDVRKEAKAYFEFFINPDSRKLEEKYKTIVSREFSRVRRRMSRARISVIKKALKEFESFSPELETVIDLHLFVIATALRQQRHYDFTDTLVNGFDAIVNRLLDLADRNMILDRAVNDLHTMATQTDFGSRSMRNRLGSLVRDYLEEHSA